MDNIIPFISHKNLSWYTENQLLCLFPGEKTEIQITQVVEVHKWPQNQNFTSAFTILCCNLRLTYSHRFRGTPSIWSTSHKYQDFYAFLLTLSKFTLGWFVRSKVDRTISLGIFWHLGGRFWGLMLKRSSISELDSLIEKQNVLRRCLGMNLLTHEGTYHCPSACPSL